MADQKLNPAVPPKTADAPKDAPKTIMGLSFGVPAFSIPASQPRVYQTQKSKFNNATVATVIVPFMFDGKSTGLSFGAHVVQTEAVAPIVRDGKKYISRSWDLKLGTVGKYKDEIDALVTDDKLTPGFIAASALVVAEYKRQRDANPAMAFNLSAAAKATGTVTADEEITD